MDQDYTVFNYGPPIPHKDVNPQDKTIVSGTGVNPSPKFALPGNSKDEFEKYPPIKPKMR